MMGMVGSSMAGSIAGSVIGHGIGNAMFGGSSTPSPQQVEQQYQQQGGQGACSVEMDQFLKCVEANNNDSASCQHLLDQLQYCRQNSN